MSEIVKVKGREILDSRGNPTVEVEITLGSGTKGMAQVPSGASTGEREALELRDKEERFRGKGVLKAIKNVNEVIGPAIIGLSAFSQALIDQKMLLLDSEEDKTKLGANAILGVSLAVAKAAASEAKLPLYRYLGGVGASLLPVPFLNILNGGVHADNNLDIQEFMIVPCGAESFSQALQMSVEIFYKLKEVLKNKGYNTSVGDEGGFAPQLNSNEEAIELILSGIEGAGYKPVKEVYLALDSAASSFYKKGKYTFENREIDSSELVELYNKWVSKYPIISIEDGMAEADLEGWALLTQTLGGKIQLVGDDLFVTNPKIFAQGIKRGLANSILIKPNQIGTLTETLMAIEMAKRAGYRAIISHRSGETEDTFIADLAVGTSVGQIKTGSVSRTERVAKYNQLLRIEEELGESSRFLGIEALVKG